MTRLIWGEENYARSNRVAPTTCGGTQGAIRGRTANALGQVIDARVRISPSAPGRLSTLLGRSIIGSII